MNKYLQLVQMPFCSLRYDFWRNTRKSDIVDLSMLCNPSPSLSGLAWKA